MLKVSSLSGGYGRKTVVNDISFTANSGDFVYILGANGCGKTTLLNMLIGYKDFSSGHIAYNGTDIKKLTIGERARCVSYIPQHHVPAFSYTVLDVVVMGRAGSLNLYESPKKSDYNQAKDALRMLGISDYAHKDYTKLSGGERQLTLIARAICQRSEVIIMDEPMQSLDFTNQSMVASAARLLAVQGRTIIMSTHAAINNYSDKDKVLLMSKNGTALFGGINEVLTQRSAEQAYGSGLELINNTDSNGGKHIICLPTAKKIYS